MQFSTTLLAMLGSAAMVSAGKVTFKTLDDVKRTIYFTCNDPSNTVDPVKVSSAEDKTVTLPDNFVGNFYAVAEGKENKPGMLGEIKYGGGFGMTYFDVSAIVDPTDKNGVKEMYPAESKSPKSGCENFPCNNAYYVWDDVQTKTTNEDHIITTLGGSN